MWQLLTTRGRALRVLQRVVGPALECIDIERVGTDHLERLAKLSHHWELTSPSSSGGDLIFLFPEWDPAPRDMQELLTASPERAAAIVSRQVDLAGERIWNWIRKTVEVAIQKEPYSGCELNQQAVNGACAFAYRRKADNGHDRGRLASRVIEEIQTTPILYFKSIWNWVIEDYIQLLSATKDSFRVHSNWFSRIETLADGICRRINQTKQSSKRFPVEVRSDGSELVRLMREENPPARLIQEVFQMIARSHEKERQAMYAASRQLDQAAWRSDAPNISQRVEHRQR